LFREKNGGAYMLASISIVGFWSFLSSAVFAIGYISGSNLFPEPLSAEEEKKCLEKLKQGNEESRNILIERNLRLVAHVAKKYGNSNVDQDDLISIGTIGLIKGINSFDAEKGSRLSTYVSRCIDNAHLTLRNYMTYSKRHSICCKTRYKRILP
jgi:RNA polymerase sporulation-specific sigma factor